MIFVDSATKGDLDTFLICGAHQASGHRGASGRVDLGGCPPRSTRPMPSDPRSDPMLSDPMPTAFPLRARH